MEAEKSDTDIEITEEAVISKERRISEGETAMDSRAARIKPVPRGQ